MLRSAFFSSIKDAFHDICFVAAGYKPDAFLPKCSPMYVPMTHSRTTLATTSPYYFAERPQFTQTRGMDFPFVSECRRVIWIERNCRAGDSDQQYRHHIRSEILKRCFEYDRDPAGHGEICPNEDMAVLYVFYSLVLMKRQTSNTSRCVLTPLVHMTV